MPSSLTSKLGLLIYTIHNPLGLYLSILKFGIQLVALWSRAFKFLDVFLDRIPIIYLVNRKIRFGNRNHRIRNSISDFHRHHRRHFTLQWKQKIHQTRRCDCHWRRRDGFDWSEMGIQEKKKLIFKVNNMLVINTSQFCFIAHLFLPFPPSSCQKKK